MKKIFDVVVIGAGSAGMAAVESARAVGASVCLIEEGKLGGECPNFACVPSKALLFAARQWRRSGAMRELGIELGERSFDFKQAMRYRETVVDRLTGGGTVGDRYVALLKRWRVEYRAGKALFVGDHTVEVAGDRVAGKTFVIATGTVEAIPPIEGLDRVRYWVSRDAVMAQRAPKSLAIVGGGPVGCELATFFASVGTRVVLLQSAARVLHREDAEISTLAQQNLDALGVEVVVDAQIDRVVSAQGAVGIHVRSGKQTQMHAVEQLLVAAGKRPNIDHLRVGEAGIAMDETRGLSTVKNQATNVRHIFAAGDVDGGMLFTHTAHHEGSIAGHNAAMLALRKRGKVWQRDERVVPRVTFVAPEVASVGLTQAEVGALHQKVLVGRFDLSGLGRSLTEGGSRGFVKLVAHPKSRKLLGAHIVADRAGEMIHEAAMAMYLGATMDKLATMIHAYPTYCEGLKAAAATAQIE